MTKDRFTLLTRQLIYTLFQLRSKNSIITIRSDLEYVICTLIKPASRKPEFGFIRTVHLLPATGQNCTELLEIYCASLYIISSGTRMHHFSCKSKLCYNSSKSIHWYPAQCKSSPSNIYQQRFTSNIKSSLVSQALQVIS